MDLKKINKNVGLAKRVFTTDKKATFNKDSISRNEAKYFVEDKFLAEQIEKKQKIDSQIIEYIEKVLKENREPLSKDEIKNVKKTINLLDEAICFLEETKLDGILKGLIEINESLLERL